MNHIRKTVSKIGISANWSDKDLDLIVKRVLRRTKTRRIVSIETIERDMINQAVCDTGFVTYDITIGKDCNIPINDRREELREMIENEMVISNL